MQKLGRAIGEREGAHRAALESAERLADELQRRVARALEVFHAAASSAGAPHLRSEVSAPRVDAKHLRAVEMNYAKAARFTDYFPSFAATYREAAPWTRLAPLNIALIRWAMDAIGLETETRVASDLGADGVRSARVAGLCHDLGARTYLSPIGAVDYLLPDLSWFEDVGVEVQFQNYQHPTYEQLYPPFASHVAAIDLILNRGREAIDILRSGRARPLTPAEVAERHAAEPALAR